MSITSPFLWIRLAEPVDNLVLPVDNLTFYRAWAGISAAQSGETLPLQCITTDFLWITLLKLGEKLVQTCGKLGERFTKGCG
jgi:hypothetical protein